MRRHTVDVDGRQIIGEVIPHTKHSLDALARSMSAIGWFTASWRKGLVFSGCMVKVRMIKCGYQRWLLTFLDFFLWHSKTPTFGSMNASGWSTSCFKFPGKMWNSNGEISSCLHLWFVKQPNSTDLRCFDDSTTLLLDHAAQYSFCVWKQWTSWSGCGCQWGKTLHQLQWSGS